MLTNTEKNTTVTGLWQGKTQEGEKNFLRCYQPLKGTIF